MNKTRPTIEQALVEAVHASSYVADAHADALMWNRDLTRLSQEGHVDFPRLKEAGAKLQVFPIVTRGFPIVGGFGLFMRKRRWPREARRDEWTRACFQIDQLERFCAASNGTASVARTAEDLDRNEREGRISAVLAVEGAQALRGRPERVEALWARGVRSMSLTHLWVNELGGTCTPFGRRSGLTSYGRDVLARMANVGMAVDLAHASPKMVADVLSGPEVPVWCSHTGIGSATPMWRNLPDEVLREIARRGGVASVIFATVFIGGRTLENLMNHLDRAIEVCGEDAVGLGSDFDGMIQLPRPMRDVRDLKRITAGLLERGHAEAAVKKVMGGNLRRFLARVLSPAARG